MKKGFTLIELLIIMVVVGVLVTVALPQYKTSLEKGRGLEGVATAAALSDAANVYYIKNYNSYSASHTDNALGLQAYVQRNAAVTKNNYFELESLTATTTDVTIKVIRTGLSSAKTYTIVFVNNGGEVIAKYCTGYKAYCNAIGAVKERASGEWDF